MAIGVSNRVRDDAVKEPARVEDELTVSRIESRVSPVQHGPARSHAGKAAEGFWPPYDLDRFWVSMLGDRMVGALGLVRVAQRVAKITLFHVDPDWQHTVVVARLLQPVYEYCWEQGCLKVIVEAGAMPLRRS